MFSLEMSRLMVCFQLNSFRIPLRWKVTESCRSFEIVSVRTQLSVLPHRFALKRGEIAFCLKKAEPSVIVSFAGISLVLGCSGVEEGVKIQIVRVTH